MGVIELLLSVLFTVGGVVVMAAVLLLARHSQNEPPGPRPPLPLLPLLAAALVVVSAPAIGLGLGGVVLEHLLLPPSVDSLRVVQLSPADLFGAQLRGAGLLALWLALPGLLAAGRLLLSRDRSSRAAWLLAAGGWLGFGVGLVLGRWVLLPAAMGVLVPPGPELTLALVDMASTAAATQLALGIAGAMAPVVWLLSSASRAALRLTIIATAAMPAAVLIVAGLTTPPDLISQLVVASAMGMSWLAGLCAGALTVFLRRERQGPPLGGIR